jgi:hypothetical protein
MSKAKTFVEYALQGFYAQTRKTPKTSDKKFFVIKKSALQQVLGMTRIGYAQRDDLQQTCLRLGIGMTELADRFIFFDPDQITAEDTYDMSSKASQLKKLTDEFHRLKRSEAEKEWDVRFEAA